MDFKYAVDVSSFFLVESIGDSEEDFDSVVFIGCNSASCMAEDDAESCCSGSSDVACMEDCSEVDEEEYSKKGGGCEQESCESHDVSDGSLSWQDVRLLEDVSESMQNDKEKMQLAKAEEDARLSEEEKNKLFWETCLAE